MTETPLDEIKNIKTRMMILGLRSIVEEQAEDEGLWFDAKLISEAYLQQELRKLHTACEALYSHVVGKLK